MTFPDVRHGRRSRSRFGGMQAFGIWATLVLASSLGGCVPLYLPPIPESVGVPEPVTVSSESSLEVRDETLVATIQLDGVTERGWLVFQWFSPSLREVASDSVWVEEGSIEDRIVVSAPASVELDEGRWRLVVSFGGVVLRQLEAAVGPGS